MKTYVKIKDILLILLIIFLFIYFIPKFSYHKEVLPNGFLISIHRITKEIDLSLPNTELILCIHPGDELYKDYLSMFKNY